VRRSRQHCQVVADVEGAAALNGAREPDGEAGDGEDVGRHRDAPRMRSGAQERDGARGEDDADDRLGDAGAGRLERSFPFGRPPRWSDAMTASEAASTAIRAAILLMRHLQAGRRRPESSLR
jgi:hypothetical protein